MGEDGRANYANYTFHNGGVDSMSAFFPNVSYGNTSSSNVTEIDWDKHIADSLYDVPAGLIALLSFFYGSISVLAVVGNSLVMWIVATSRRMQNVTNCFIANLALADIVIGLFAIPFQFQAALLQRWNLPHFMCPFCPFVQVLSVNVSVFTLTAIAVDRHRAILNPLSARPSKKIAKLIIAGIWLLSLILATPMIIALRVIEAEEVDPNTHKIYVKPFCDLYNLSEESMVIYRTILLFLQYLIPLCVISFVYARMAFQLWGWTAPGNAQDSRDANLMRNKKKVIKMLVIVVALFALCWLPLQTYQVLQACFPINEYRYINIIFFCCDWLAMSNSCYNPFIYGIYNEKFKREFKQRFPCGRNNWNQNLATDSVDLDKSHSTIHTRHSSLRSTYDWRRSTRHSHTASQNHGQSRPLCTHQSMYSRRRGNCFDDHEDIECSSRRGRVLMNRDAIDEDGRRHGRSCRNAGVNFNGNLLNDDANSKCTNDNHTTEMYVFGNRNFSKLDNITEF